MTVTGTSPIWFYCGQTGHCQQGMVGVINEPLSGNRLAVYAANAHRTNRSVNPPRAEGGVVVEETTISESSLVTSVSVVSISSEYSSVAVTATGTSQSSAATTGAGVVSPSTSEASVLLDKLSLGQAVRFIVGLMILF